MNKQDKNREFQLAKREFKRLSKRELIKTVFELQTLILNLKAKNVELERMLEERGDVILEQKSLLEEQKKDIYCLRASIDNWKLRMENEAATSSGAAIDNGELLMENVKGVENGLRGVEWGLKRNEKLAVGCMGVAGMLLGIEGIKFIRGRSKKNTRF